MDIKELNSFKLSDAVKFHDKLNPNLWMGSRLDPAVKKQLLLIAEDFISELGIKDLDVEDVTISGSNAAYTYTPHSDLDLHILVDMDKFPADEVYRELFQAKKTLYNDTHDISVHGVPVELYVQDKNQPVVSLGEYSLLKDKWLKFPTKRRANLDQNATRAKYERLKELVELALRTRDLERVTKALSLIKRYRKAGLDKGGEFSPENLAFKVIRKQGGIQKLYDLRNELHSEELTIEEMYSGPKMKFLKPGELRGSYSDYQLLGMGFKKSQNGSWYIPQVKWDKLRASNQIGEDDLNEKYAKEFEDYHPNAKPRGPEFKPTMPAGTVRVDVSDVYDWYKLGQHVSNLKGLGKHDFGKGPPSTILSFGDEDTEHKYIKDLEKTGLTTTDIDPVDPNQPKGMKRQKTDPTFKVDEDETLQYTAEKTTATNPYGGMKDRQYRRSISENSDTADIKFTQEPYEGWNGMGAMITAYSEGHEIGHVIFEPTDNDKNKWYATEVEVEDDFQRRGIATAMYDMAKEIAKKANAVIVPSHAQTSDAKGMWKDKKVWEASGYIPSAKEKNDPRFKAALTVDVKPDSIKKNAKAFSWLTSRAGIPPDARPDGKI
jgi:predicted GNAT family acetyltransferase